MVANSSYDMASITEIKNMLEENQKSLLAAFQTQQAFVDNSIYTITGQLKDLEKNVNSKLRTLSDDMQDNSNSGLPKTPKKNRRRIKPAKVKRETSHFFKSLGSDSDCSVNSNFSMLSNKEDVKIIKLLSKPTFQSEDAKMKQQLDELKRIQEKYLKRIPKLAYSTSDSSDNSPPVHNYGLWINALLKYYFVLSPQLSSTVKRFLQTVDVDNLLIDGTQLEYPIIDEDSLFIRFASMSAITDTVSDDFVELLENDDDANVFVNVFSTLTNILVFCSPNSQEDRVENISEFFNQVQGDSNQVGKNESITKFAKRVVEKARKTNGQYETPQISQEQIYSTVINGIKKGSQKEAYEKALDALKFNMASSRSVNIQATVLWLYRKCDKSKLPVPQSASLANYRGGGRGGRGGGGRGRGGRGSRNNENKNQSPVPEDSGSVTWKETLYAVTDQDGVDQVAKEIKERKNNQPCFKLITNKSCPLHQKGKCPYNHEFNIIDTRKSNSSSSNGTQSGPSAPPAPPIAPAADVSAAHFNSNNSNSDKQQSGMDSSDSSDNSDSSAFDYAYNLGFAQKSSAARSMRSISSNSLSTSFYSVISTLTNTDLLNDCLHFVFMLWFLLLSLPHILFSSVSVVSSMSDWCYGVVEQVLFFVVPLALFQPIDIPMKSDFFTMDSIGSYNNILYSVPTLTNLKSITDFDFLPLLILLALLVTYLRLTKTKSFKHLGFGARVRQALYKIILDCGCTFTMSGDRGLFIESSLVTIHEEVGLAESGKMSIATHKGKMVVDGKIIDALYVPDFKQTMISMGQLERMGLTYSKTAHNVRSFLTDKGDVFLSFCIAPNNLYPLLSRSQSASAGVTSDSS